MSLRTYSLITHPAFLRHVEAVRFKSHRYENLAATEVPVHRPLLEHASDIARYLGINPVLILGVMRNADKHYRTFEFRKRSGGMREINAPRTYLKVIQWWILDTILSGAEPSIYAHGFVPGRSFVTNAKSHLGAKYVLNVDIKDFFPSITADQVAQVFLNLGYRSAVATDLALLCTLEGRLPQGAPTSPALANLVLNRTDGVLAEIATNAGLNYTRYADDLTFSSRHRIDASLVGLISAAIGELDLVLNPEKTHFMGPNQKLRITGLVLGKESAVLDRRYLNGLRGWFHAALVNPTEYRSHCRRILGAVSLLNQVGGRGTEKLAELGALAVQHLSVPD